MTSSVCQTVQQVTGTASAAASAAHKTVQKLSKTAKNLRGNSSGSGGTSAAGKSKASGGGAHQSHSGAQRYARRSAPASRAEAGIAATTVGLLTPLGLSQQLNFPKVYPARHAAARAVRPSSTVPRRVWLMFLIGGLGLVGGAGGYFLGWPRLRRPRARTIT